MTRRTALAVLGPVAAVVLAGCGGGSASSTPTAGGSGSSPATPASGGSSAPGPVKSSYPTTVQGVRLTAQGSRLRVGQTARVTWKPDQKTVGVVAISVTGLRRVPISAFTDWRLDAATRRSTPYYVHATVRNLGRSNLSGRPVPLYLLDQRNTLLQASTFQAEFPACPSRPLPAGFRHGKRVTACLVYFAPDHGKLVAVSFRPDQQFDAITWRGHVSGKGSPHARHRSHHQHKKHKKHAS